MRRHLVLTDEAARHPMRRMLPPTRYAPPRDEDKDLKLFVLSFTAFFIVFYSFIA